MSDDLIPVRVLRCCGAPVNNLAGTGLRRSAAIGWTLIPFVGQVFESFRLISIGCQSPFRLGMIRLC